MQYSLPTQNIVPTNFEFLPLNSSKVPEGSSLIFSPHPDDETFGCGGMILKLTNNGQIVNLVLMTNGEKGGDVNIRKLEVESAMELLGIDHCHFFNAEDFGLQFTEDNIRKIVQLLDKYSPDNVFFPSPLEYHPDHRVTAWLVWFALQRKKFQGNVFAYEIANPSPINFLINIDDVMERKIQIISGYKSQLESINYVEIIESMNRVRAYSLLEEKSTYAEAYFHFPDINADLMSYYFEFHQRFYTEMDIIGIEEKNSRLKNLKENLERVKKQNGYLNHHINQLLKEKIKEYDEGDLAKRDFELSSTRNYETQCMALFEEVFKEKMTKEFWHWKYAPHGMKWRGVCVVKDEKVVGHYNGVARTIRYFGQWKLAVQPCDTMTSAKHRGGIKQNSPYYSMTKTFFAQNIGNRKKFLLSFGFPNRRVMSLAEKLGLYSEVDTITEIVWEISDLEASSAYSLEQYMADEKIDTELLELWKSMASDFKEDILGVRNPDYLNYRYVQHPKFNYEIFLLRDRQKKLQGAFVLKKENDTMLFMDVVAKKEQIAQTIAHAITVVKEKQCKRLKCWITTSKAMLFNHQNAIQKEIDVSIAFGNTKDALAADAIKEKWLLMYGDTDFI